MSALILGLAGVVSALEATPGQVVDRGHAVVHAAYDVELDEWSLGVRSGGHNVDSPLYPIDETVLLLAPASGMVIPEGLSEAWSFLGQPGDVVWISPEGSAPADVLRLGFDQSEVQIGDLSGDGDRNLTYTMTGFDGSDSFFLYSQSAGNPSIWLDSRQEEMFGSVDPPGGHSHFNWAFLSRGIYFVTLQASGIRSVDAVETSSDPETLTFLVAPSPRHWWLLEKFGREANQPVAALDASPAGDGVANLLKYAFDLDPFVPSRSHLPTLRTILDDDEGERFVLSFRQPEGREDLSYHLEYAVDLAAQWDEVEMEALPRTWALDPDGTPVVNVEIGDAGGRRHGFWRVRISVINGQEG